MTLKNDTELAESREKLQELEDRYQARHKETAKNAQVHALMLQSLMELITQLKAEIAVYEAH